MAEDHKVFAYQFYKIMEMAANTGDLKLLDGVISIDAVDHNRDGSLTSGLANIKEKFEVFLKAFSEIEFKVEDVIAEGDKLAVRITVLALQVGEYRGVINTNKRVKFNGVDILYFRDNKLQQRWGEFSIPRVILN